MQSARRKIDKIAGNLKAEAPNIRLLYYVEHLSLEASNRNVVPRAQSVTYGKQIVLQLERM